MPEKQVSDYAAQYGNTDQGLINFLQQFVNAGHLTSFEAGQYIQALPQAQQQRLEQQTGQYSQMLAQSDQEIMGRAGEQLTSRFAQQGRPRSSGYTAAYLNAARDLALSRQPQIAQFYGQGLQGIGQAYGQMGQGAVARGFGLTDEQRQRNWDIEDYYRQQGDYNAALNAQNRRNRTGMVGSLIGTGVGAYLGSYAGPGGTMAGAKLGSKLGGSAGMWG